MKTIRSLLWVIFALRARTMNAQGGIAGTIYDSLSAHAPLANATVVLVERDRYATTDGRGRFHFDGVPDGLYTLGFAHPVLDSLDLELPVVPVIVAGGKRAAVMLATPSQATVYARLCPGIRETNTGVIIGRVRDVDDHAPLASATVSTDWTEFTLGTGRPVGHRVSATAQSNPHGVYFLCGVPTDIALDLESTRGGFDAGPVQLSLGKRVMQRVDFAISLADSGAVAPSPGDSSSDAANRRGTASLHGAVFNGDNRPVREAIVDVLGSTRATRSDGTGGFLLDAIPAGTRTVQLKAIGLLPVSAAMDFPTRGLRDTTFSMTRRAQPLESDTVKARALPLPLMDDGFETRRLHGLGAYVTADQIARHNFPDLASILRGVRGVRIDCNATKARQGMSCLPMPAMVGITDLASASCVPSVFLNGVPFTVTAITDPRGITPDPPRFQELSEIVRPEMVRGIEVYSSPGTTPAQYDRSSSTGCGSIVIWTK
jgi:hypothetical protein